MARGGCHFRLLYVSDKITFIDTRDPPLSQVSDTSERFLPSITHPWQLQISIHSPDPLAVSYFSLHLILFPPFSSLPFLPSTTILFPRLSPSPMLFSALYSSSSFPFLSLFLFFFSRAMVGLWIFLAPSCSTPTHIYWECLGELCGYELGCWLLDLATGKATA